MLEITEVGHSSDPDDCMFAFSGGNAVSSLRLPPQEPWRRRELITQLGQPLIEVPIGLWLGKPCYAVEVSPDRLDPIETRHGQFVLAAGTGIRRCIRSLWSWDTDAFLAP